MVTKIREYTGCLPFEANFEPTGTSGLNFGHSGGAVTGIGVIKETVAGNVAVPASSAWSIYASYTSGLLVGSTTASVPSTDALVLFQGTSDGSAITSWIDYRSWTSTALISAGQGFDEFLTGTVAPNRVLDFKFDETSGTVANFGTATLASLNALFNVTYSQTGDVSYETDDSIKISGAGPSTMARTTGLNPFNTPNMATGHIGIVFKTNTATSNSFTQQDIMFDAGSASTTQRCLFRGQGTGTTTRVEVEILDTGTGYTSLTRCENVGGLDDDNFHMWICVQDGSGPKHYVDGVLYTNTGTGGFTRYLVGGLASDWFDDKKSQGRIAVGSATALGNNMFDGNFSRLWVSTDIPSAGDITSLNEARTALI
jgi:hypothetical protein